MFWLGRCGRGRNSGYETVATFPPGIKKAAAAALFVYQDFNEITNELG
jgi:hypothetical protein